MPAPHRQMATRRAEMCATKGLIGGDGELLADIYRKRVLKRGSRQQTWGWETAYGAAS